jgi:hypothetical protein
MSESYLLTHCGESEHGDLWKDETKVSTMVHFSTNVAELESNCTLI